MAQPRFSQEFGILRRISNDPLVHFAYTNHALDEMRKDQLTKPDIESVLKRCPVIRVEMSKWEETWNIRGRDLDERMLEVVVVAYEDQLKIKVVTAWKAKI